MTTIWEVDHATPQSVPAVGWRSWSAPWPPASRWRGASTKTGNFRARLDVVKPPQPLGFMSRLWVKHDVPFLLCYTKYLRVISNPVLLSAALGGTFRNWIWICATPECCICDAWNIHGTHHTRSSIQVITSSQRLDIAMITVPVKLTLFSFWYTLHLVCLHFSSIVFVLDAYFHHNKK